MNMEAPITTEAPNDVDAMKKLEDDHLHLQRQVRMIQTDRLQRCMGVHPTFRRQDNLLNTLKKEYVDLVLDLKIARSGAHKKKDKKMKKDLNRTLLFSEEAQVNCAGGLAITDELEGLLQINTKEMLKLRQTATACQGEIEARRFQSQGRLLSAENKLEAAMLRFNRVQCENRAIREEIEHMLKDREIFNQAWKKMLTALGKGKKFLSDLFESSTLAYDQRDEWVSKLRSIQEKGKMDQMLQIQEMRDLKKLYDHEMKIYLFLGKKGVMRVNLGQQEKEEEKKRTEEERLKLECDKHDRILEEIRDYTQECCYDKIIEDFQKREQNNFSIYKLIADFCAEMEILSRDVNRLRQEVEDRRETNEMKDIERQHKLATLNKQLEEQKQRTSVVRAKYEQQEKLLKDTMNKIQDIFKLLDCSLEPFQQLLGDKMPTLHQFSLTMCLITEKIKQQIEYAYYFERYLKRSEKPSTSRLKKFMIQVEPRTLFQPKPIQSIVTAEPCPSCIETRWIARVCDTPEQPFDKKNTLSALSALATDPAYERYLKRSEKPSTSRLKKFMIQVEPRTLFQPKPIQSIVTAEPCPSCIETRWIARVCDTPEQPFDKKNTLSALSALATDPAYVRSDRVHALADCRASASRKLLATRHMNY